MKTILSFLLILSVLFPLSLKAQHYFSCNFDCYNDKGRHVSHAEKYCIVGKQGCDAGCFGDQAFANCYALKSGDQEELDETAPGISKIYPIPSNGDLNIDYVSATEGKVQLIVYNITGREVFSSAYEVNSGINLLKLILSDLNSGIYFLSLKNGDAINSMKFMIE